MANNIFDFNSAKPFMSPERSFYDAIVSAGLPSPGTLIPDDKIYRFGDDRECWYVMFADLDCPGGVAGSWRTGEKITWSYRTDLNDIERQEHHKRVEKARKKQEDERKAIAQKAQQEATEAFSKAKAVEVHPYLQKKGIKAHGIKLYRGNIIIPMRDIAGTIHSVQQILPDGKKLFWPGGSVVGMFHIIPGRGKTYICEGYATGATIHEATGATVYIAFSAHNLKTVAALLPPTVIVAADNDHKTEGNPGLTVAKETGKNYVYPQGIEGTDFNDMASEKGIKEVQRQLAPQGNKFQQRVLLEKELHTAFLETLKMGWTIDKVLPESSSLIVTFGPPSGGKSFAVLDMCLSVSTGKEWHGKKVKKKSVLYLAAEGQAGMLKRIKAWCKYYVLKPHDFALLPMPCLIDHEAQRYELLQMIESLPFQPGIIVLDTLARSMMGDENSTKDMGLVVSAAGILIEETGAQVIIIHHTGKDETKGARGAIALTGATDTMFKVVRSKEPKQYLLTCERQKDNEPFEPMAFDFVQIDTGYVNIDNDPIISLVPEYNPDVNVKEKARKKSLNPIQKIDFKALNDAIKIKGISFTDEILDKISGLVLPGDKMVNIEEWRKTAITKNISSGGDRAIYNAFSRAVQVLCSEDYVRMFNNYAWIARNE